MPKTKKKKPYKNLFIGSLRNFLRKLWLQSPLRSQRLKTDAVYVQKTKKDGSLYLKPTKIGYTCYFCEAIIEKGNEVVHHKRCLPPFDLENLWKYIENLLFIDVSDLATCCKECHKAYHKENGNDFIEKT